MVDRGRFCLRTDHRFRKPGHLRYRESHNCANTYCYIARVFNGVFLRLAI